MRIPHDVEVTAQGGHTDDLQRCTGSPDGEIYDSCWFALLGSVRIDLM